MTTSYNKKQIGSSSAVFIAGKGDPETSLHTGRKKWCAVRTSGHLSRQFKGLNANLGCAPGAHRIPNSSRKQWLKCAPNREPGAHFLVRRFAPIWRLCRENKGLAANPTCAPGAHLVRTLKQQNERSKK
jgi:hypothetical protein